MLKISWKKFKNVIGFASLKKCPWKKKVIWLIKQEKSFFCYEKQFCHICMAWLSWLDLETNNYLPWNVHKTEQNGLVFPRKLNRIPKWIHFREKKQQAMCQRTSTYLSLSFPLLSLSLLKQNLEKQCIKQLSTNHLLCLGNFNKMIIK